MCVSFPVSVNDRIFSTNMICLPFKRINVVLGMDCLSSNSIYICYKEKTIFIPTEETSPDDAISTLLDGTISMIHCLYEQDKTFILILNMDSNERKQTLLISVVCEFTNVFLEDVTYLPPNR